MGKITKFKDIPRFTPDGTWQSDFTLEYLIQFIDKEVKEHGLQLNPNFQRGHVWTENQQIRWLEFFLRGGKTSRVIYLNKPSWNRSVPEGDYDEYVCVDGLQRLTAIQKFMNNEIKVFGSYYKEYTDSMRMVHSIKININDLKSEKEVLQWYVDMNSGGVPHTSGEIERVKKMISELG